MATWTPLGYQNQQGGVTGFSTMMRPGAQMALRGGTSLQSLAKSGSGYRISNSPYYEVGGSSSYSGAGSPSSMPQSLQDSRNSVLDMTRGRADELKSDPYTMAAMDRLRSMTNGQDAPFTQDVQNRMIGEQTGMNAAAAQAQQGQMRNAAMAAGGSINDPSFRAAQRQTMADRQGANVKSVAGVRNQAQLANFDARFGGANALAAARGGQNALINQSLGRAVDFLSADTYSKNLAGGMAAGGGGSNPRMGSGVQYGSSSSPYGGSKFFGFNDTRSGGTTSPFSGFQSGGMYSNLRNRTVNPGGGDVDLLGQMFR